MIEIPQDVRELDDGVLESRYRRLANVITEGNIEYAAEESWCWETARFTAVTELVVLDYERRSRESHRNP